MIEAGPLCIQRRWSSFTESEETDDQENTTVTTTHACRCVTQGQASPACVREVRVSERPTLLLSKGTPALTAGGEGRRSTSRPTLHGLVSPIQCEAHTS